MEEHYPADWHCGVIGVGHELHMLVVLATTDAVALTAVSLVWQLDEIRKTLADVGRIDRHAVVVHVLHIAVKVRDPVLERWGDEVCLLDKKVGHILHEFVADIVGLEVLHDDVGLGSGFEISGEIVEVLLRRGYVVENAVCFDRDLLVDAQIQLVEGKRRCNNHQQGQRYDHNVGDSVLNQWREDF